MKQSLTVQEFAHAGNDIHTRVFLNGRQIGALIVTKAEWRQILDDGVRVYRTQPHAIAARQKARA